VVYFKIGRKQPHKVNIWLYDFCLPQKWGTKKANKTNGCSFGSVRFGGDRMASTNKEGQVQWV